MISSTWSASPAVLTPAARKPEILRARLWEGRSVRTPPSGFGDLGLSLVPPHTRVRNFAVNKWEEREDVMR